MGVAFTKAVSNETSHVVIERAGVPMFGNDGAKA
jgi:hypothetical protein